MKNPFKELRNRLKLTLEKYSHLTKINIGLCVRLEHGLNKDIPDHVLNSLADLKLIENKHDLINLYNEFIKTAQEDIRKGVLSGR